jgi:tRNA (cmo5U34)-methyltransferase
VAFVKPCSFDRVAPFYPALETLVFGGALTRARNRALYSAEDISGGAHWLLLGEGNGRFLLELFRKHPRADVTCLEPSARMRESQRARLLKNLAEAPETWAQVPLRVQDWAAPEARFARIVTHFFLDLFGDDEIDAVVGKISSSAAPGARWCVAEFAPARAPLNAALSRALIRTMYLFFRLSANLRTRRLPDWRAALLRHGWRLRDETASVGGLIVASVWERGGD